MPRKSTLMRSGSLFALVLLFAGCTKGGQFDPVALFDNDMFDTKTKLKGEREPLFPNGVPGTTTGVPADLVKGYQPPPDQADATAAEPGSGAPAPETAAAPAAAASAAKPAPKPKPKPKPKLAAAPSAQKQDPVWNQNSVQTAPTRISVGGKSGTPVSGQQATPAQPNWPTPQGAPAQPQPDQSVWPAPPPTGAPQQTAQPSQSVWPAPPPTGTTSQ